MVGEGSRKAEEELRSGDGGREYKGLFKGRGGVKVVSGMGGREGGK